MSKHGRKNLIGIFVIIVTAIGFSFLWAYVGNYNEKNTFPVHKPRTPEEKVSDSLDIIIHEKTPTSISFRVLDGNNKPKLRANSNLRINRNKLKKACENFNPWVDCMTCEIADVKYSVRGYVVFVEVQNIPPDHYKETVESISYLLFNYITEVKLDNK